MHNKFLGIITTRKSRVTRRAGTGAIWDQVLESGIHPSPKQPPFYDLIEFKIITAHSIFAYSISNYYFVVHNIAALSIKIVIVSKDPIICTTTNLQDMYHCFRTAFGDSTYSYGGENIPYH